MVSVTWPLILTAGIQVAAVAALLGGLRVMVNDMRSTLSGIRNDLKDQNREIGLLKDRQAVRDTFCRTTHHGGA